MYTATCSLFAFYKNPDTATGQERPHTLHSTSEAVADLELRQEL